MVSLSRLLSSRFFIEHLRRDSSRPQHCPISSFDVFVFRLHNHDDGGVDDQLFFRAAENVVTIPREALCLIYREFCAGKQLLIWVLPLCRHTCSSSTGIISSSERAFSVWMAHR